MLDIVYTNTVNSARFWVILATVLTHSFHATLQAQNAPAPAQTTQSSVNPNDPADLYLQYFIKSKEAERAEKQGDSVRALALHETALRIINQIQKVNPQWRSGLVGFRVKATQDKINALRFGAAPGAIAAQVPSQQPGRPVPDAPVAPQPPSTPYPAPMPQQQNIEQIQNTIAEQQRAYQQMQQQQSAIADQTAGARQQLDLLDQTRAQLMETQRQLQAAQIERDTLRQRLNNSMQGSPVLAREVEQLRERLAKAEAQLSAIQDSESEAIDSMRSQLEATQERLKRVMLHNEELENQNSTLTAQLADAQMRLSQAPLSGASSGQAEMLRIENELLRDIMNRQIADQPNRDRARQMAMEEIRKLKIQSDVLDRQIEVLASPQVQLTQAQMDWLRNARPSLSTEIGIPAGDYVTSAPPAYTPSAAGASAYSQQEAMGGETAMPNTISFGIPPDMQREAADAVTAFGSGDLDRAASQFMNIIQRHPGNVYALSNIGVVLIEMKQYDRALEFLSKATAYAPEDGFSFAALGIAQYMSGRVNQAIETLNRAVSLNPSDPQARNYLGLACAKDGRVAIAESELLKAIEIKSDYAEAYYNLAVVYATQQPPNTAKARQYYDRAVSLGMVRNVDFEVTLPKF